MAKEIPFVCQDKNDFNVKEKVTEMRIYDIVILIFFTSFLCDLEKELLIKTVIRVIDTLVVVYSKSLSKRFKKS